MKNNYTTFIINKYIFPQASYDNFFYKNIVTNLYLSCLTEFYNITIINKINNINKSKFIN